MDQPDGPDPDARPAGGAEPPPEGYLGFSVRENIFLSWVGLRGAVPVLLAIYPVITPGPVTIEFFNIVFVIVVTSLIAQGWTIVPLANLLRLGKQDEQEDVAET